MLTVVPSGGRFHLRFYPLNPLTTKGHICPMFLKCSQIWLRQSRVLNCIHTDSLCYWLYVNKPGCDIYSLASLPNWQELSLEMPSINRKFDFLYKNNDVTKQKIDIGLAFVCAYRKVLMLFIPHLFSETTRWFKYDWDWFVCKQAALRSSCATLREWSHNLHPPSCSG